MVDIRTKSHAAFGPEAPTLLSLRGGQLGRALDTLKGDSVGRLRNLHEIYREQAELHATGPLQHRVHEAMTGGYVMPSPMTVMPLTGSIAGGFYAGGEMQWIDLAPRSKDPVINKMLRPLQKTAGRAERALRKNPVLRMQFESHIGGRVLDFGSENEGKMKVQRFGGGFMANMAMFSPYASHIFGHIGSMDVGAESLFGKGAKDMFGGNPFSAFMMGGLGHMMGFEPGAHRVPNYGSQGVAGGGWSPFDNTGPLGGRRFGSWNPFAMPGHINNTNPIYERRHQAEAAAILADPSLTVEDQVVLILMLVMKKADDDIKRQAQYINSVQQQQARNPGEPSPGMGGNVFGGYGTMWNPWGPNNPMGGGNDAPTIDVETMKLKRMTDKRSQMFDMLRQIVDKYNQTAKSMIDSIGR